ncbi:hypothetical protein BDW69DRAFT_26827 [Aspergillus filifer]
MLPRLQASIITRPHKTRVWSLYGHSWCLTQKFNSLRKISNTLMVWVKNPTTPLEPAARQPKAAASAASHSSTSRMVSRDELLSGKDLLTSSITKSPLLPLHINRPLLDLRRRSIPKLCWRMIRPIVSSKWWPGSPMIPTTPPSRSNISEKDSCTSRLVNANSWHDVRDAQTTVCMPFEVLAVPSNFCFNLGPECFFVVFVIRGIFTGRSSSRRPWLVSACSLPRGSTMPYSQPALAANNHHT